MQTNIDIPVSADNMDFDVMCRKAAENIHLLKEDELDTVPRITPEMVRRYGNTEFVQFGKDGKMISFSFGIPMPN